jgi:hypothetical protein
MKKTLFEGTFPITLDILCGIWHDFRLESAPSRKGTSIERLESRLEPLDEYGYFYRLYLQIGSNIFGSVADFDIRKLNDKIKITIPSSEGNLTVYSDGEWNRILGELNNSLSTEGDLVRDYGWEMMSGEIDHFLSSFGTYLQGLFPDNKEAKAADQEIHNNLSVEQRANGGGQREELLLEEQKELNERKKAKQFHMNVNRLQRWDRLKNYKEELLSVEKMAERESKASRTIKKDFQDMKKVGYIQ